MSRDETRMGRSSMSRVAVVTGGASGMGEATCHELGRRGHKVAVLDLDGEAAQRVCRGLARRGRDRAGRCRRRQRPRRRRGGVRQGPHRTRPGAHPGHQRGCWWTSRRSPRSPSRPGSGSSTVNLTGTFHCCQVAVPDMLEAGWGRIVMISSSSAQRGSPKHGALRGVQGRAALADQIACPRIRSGGHHGQQHSAVGHRDADAAPGAGGGPPAVQRADGRRAFRSAISAPATTSPPRSASCAPSRPASSPARYSASTAGR